MKLPAVFHHAGLDWCRRCNAITGSRSRRYRGVGRGADAVDADVGIRPETRTIGAYRGVPALELLL